MLLTLALSAALQAPPAEPPPTVPPPPPPGAYEAAIAAEEAGAVLDAMHAAASAADGETYFALFTPDARFIGTDATERWILPELRAYAEPYFAQGRGWTYRPRERIMQVSPSREVAWFDERLDNDTYGEMRGSGVLARTPDGWRIAQYVLSFAVPNDAAEDVVARIRQGPPPQSPPSE